LQRYWAFRAAQDKTHPVIWTDPRGYYFLNILVVKPEYQRNGVGAAMVKTVTDIADAEGMPCYLESSKAKPNMDIYESWGFKLVKEMDCQAEGDDGICRLYCMIRDPKTE